jgi:integrase
MHSLSESQLQKLLAVSDDFYRPLFLVAYRHGLRVTEVINLTHRNFQDGYLTVKRLKGSLKTTHEMTPEVREEIERVLARTPRGEKLFPISRQAAGQAMVRFGKLAGIPRPFCHMHCLKHTVAMHNRGAGVEVLKQYLGHKSGNSTLQYLKLNDAEACAAIAAHSARAGGV